MDHCRWKENKQILHKYSWKKDSPSLSHTGSVTKYFSNAVRFSIVNWGTWSTMNVMITNHVIMDLFTNRNKYSSLSCKSIQILAWSHITNLTYMYQEEATHNFSTVLFWWISGLFSNKYWSEGEMISLSTDIDCIPRAVLFRSKWAQPICPYPQGRPGHLLTLPSTVPPWPAPFNVNQAVTGTFPSAYSSLQARHNMNSSHVAACKYLWQNTATQLQSKPRSNKWLLS